jgi:hypothetical protein
MLRSFKRLFIHLSLVIVTFTGFTQSVQAAMVGTDQAHAAVTSQQNRERIINELNRPDVLAQLEQLGVASADAHSRVAALTNEEAALMADRMDSMPAGADGVVGAIVFIFVLLVVTDLLGLTKIFPFTRAQR